MRSIKSSPKTRRGNNTEGNTREEGSQQHIRLEPLGMVLRVLFLCLLWAETQAATVYMSLKASNMSVAAPSNYTISFNRSQNSLGQAISPSPLASDYLIVISFANSYDISTLTMTPPPQLISTATQTATLLLSSPITALTISNFTNPLPSGTPFSISLNFYNASAPSSLVDSCSGSLTFSAVNLGAVTATFSPGNISTVSNLTIKVVPFAWDAALMKLALNFMTYWQRNLLNVSSNQVLSSMSYCVPACTIQNMGSFITVSLAPALASGTLSFTIHNVLSPPTLEPDSLSLAIVQTAYSSDVQTGAFSVAAVSPNNLQLLTATTSSKVGQSITLSLSIASQDLFSSADSIVIAFNTTLSMSAQITISNPLVSSFAAQVQQNYLVTISGFSLVTTIPSQFSGSVVVTQLAAQSSSQPVAGSSITFYRNGAIYDQSYFQFSVAAGALSVSAALASSSANAATTLTLTLTLNAVVGPTDSLFAFFDQAITLYNCTVAGCTGCQCTTAAANPASGQVSGKVTVSSFPSAGLSNLILLVGVKNPIASGYILTLSTVNANSFTKDAGQVAYPTIIQSSIASGVFSLAKSGDVVYGISNYTMTLNLSGYSLVNGWMTIKFDLSVALLDPASPQCLSNGDSAACVVTYGSGYILTNTSVSSGISLYAITLSNCRNPPSTRYFNFQVSLTDKANLVYYTLSSPYFQASTPFAITPSVTSSSCTNLQSNTVTVTFPYLPFAVSSGLIVDKEGASYLAGENILRKIGYPLEFNSTVTIAATNSYSLESVYYSLLVVTADQLYSIFSFTFSLTNCQPAALLISSYRFSGLPEDAGTFVFSFNQVLANNAQGNSFSTIKYVEVQFPGEYPSSLSVSSNALSTTTVSPRTFRLGLGSEQPVSVELWGFSSVIGSAFAIAAYAQSEAGSGLSYLISTNTTLQYSLSTLTSCQFPCKLCSSTNSSICLQCYSNALTPQYFLDPLSHVCVTPSNCPSSTFPNYTGSVCQSCLSTCSRCLSLVECTSCAVNYYLLNASCLTDCPSGYYPISASQLCGNCLSGNTGHCLTCVTLNTCSSCQYPYLFQPSSKTCVDSCSTGQILLNGTCFNCDSLCATCTMTTSNCTSCSSGYYLLVNQCLSVCPSPYVPSSTVNACENCSAACLSCAGVATTCTACNSPLKLLESSCINDCPVGYYLFTSTSGGQCLRCSSPCFNCSSASVCTSCQTGYYYYLGTCLLGCPTATYPSTTSSMASCAACPNACTSCLNGSSCAQCQQGYYLSGAVCVSSCGASQYVSGTTCLDCPSGCLTCISGGICLVCSETTYLLSAVCIQTCPPGYAGVAVSYGYSGTTLTTAACRSCASLFTNCALCTGTGCVGCNVGYVSLGTQCLSACPEGYLNVSSQCLNCNSECKGCTNFMYNCTACSSGWLYLNSTTSISRCLIQCPASTYASTSSCLSCLSPCLTCSGSASTCLSCLDGFYSLATTALNCVSTCPPNSYVYLHQCVLCASDCLLCDSLGCKQCGSNYLHDQGSVVAGVTYFQCYSSCPSTLPFLISKTCSKCSEKCVTCSSIACLECSSGWSAYQQYCLSQCPPQTTAVSGVCAPINSTTTNNTTTIVTPLPNKAVPVPFTIVTACVWLCVLISKYIHPQTAASLSVFSLLSVVAAICNVFYVVRAFLAPPSGQTSLYVYILIVGVAVSYANNVIFIFLSRYSLLRDEEFVKWKRGNVELVKEDRERDGSQGQLQDQLNVGHEGSEEVPKRLTTYECFWNSILITGVITSHNLYTILFSKLFGLSVFKAHIQTMKTFRLLNYLWVSSIVSFMVSFISGIVLAASLDSTKPEYVTEIYESADLIFVNFIFFLLGFLLLKKKKETWAREDVSPHGSEQDSTKKVIFEQENNDFDMRSILESQEEVNGKVMNLANDPNLCRQGFLESSNKSSTNEVDSDLFFQNDQSENLDKESGMKIQENILFMQIPPEDMTPHLVERQTDDKDEMENHSANAGGGVPSLEPGRAMEELDLQKIRAGGSESAEEGSESEEEKSEKRQLEEWGFTEDDGEQAVKVDPHQQKLQENEAVPEQTVGTEGLLLPIEEEEAEHNKEEKERSEDEGLVDEKIEYAVATIDPDLAMTISENDLPGKKVAQSKQSMEEIEGAEMKDVKNQKKRRRRRDVKERIEERYRQSPTEGKEKNNESARISGLRDMFASSQAYSPVPKAKDSPAKNIPVKVESPPSRMGPSQQAQPSFVRRDRQQLRVSSSAHNFKHPQESLQQSNQVFFDDKLQTINADAQDNEPQRYKYNTIFQEKGVIGESSNARSIYKSINIAKINNRLGSALGDRPSKIEMRTVSRDGIRVRSTFRPARTARSTAKDFSFSKPKEVADNDQKPIWTSRVIGPAKPGENLKGTAHIIQRKSKLASSRAQLQQIYISRK